ncbi:hypothetical protein EDC01DRAFT_631515 [Geopyxis carbonaria]|nr:hypothetical protein EDC01DRAFT_631515 [Geopyxis carbonaria]
MKASIALTFVTLCASAFSTPLGLEKRRNLERTVYPNYLNPIYKNQSSTAFPTQYTATINYDPSSTGNEVRMLVGFDIPAGVGTRCAIKFALPPKTQGGYPWVVSGTGKLDVYQLAEPFTNGVTNWNNKPARLTSSPQFTITQTTAASGGPASMTGTVIACLDGQRQDFEVVVTRPGPAKFDWFG